MYLAPVKNYKRRGSQTNKFNSFLNDKNVRDESRIAPGRLF